MLIESHRIAQLRSYLDPVATRFEQATFIQDDPISIPHGFEDPRDREIIGLFAALLAWGRRDIMLAKLGDLCERMDFRPADFISSYSVHKRDRIDGFVHRTFNSSDLEGLILSLQALTAKQTLESVFVAGATGDEPIKGGIQHLADQLFNHVPGQPARIRKHLARPSTGSACKRWNMYLRWMVRSGPVDMGLWKQIRTEDLILPLDVHSGTQARAVGLLSRKSNDWKAAIELTENCRALCALDPCKYDFALFGAGSSGETLDHII